MILWMSCTTSLVSTRYFCMLRHKCQWICCQLVFQIWLAISVDWGLSCSIYIPIIHLKFSSLFIWNIPTIILVRLCLWSKWLKIRELTYCTLSFSICTVSQQSSELRAQTPKLKWNSSFMNIKVASTFIK